MLSLTLEENSKKTNKEINEEAAEEKTQKTP